MRPLRALRPSLLWRTATTSRLPRTSFAARLPAPGVKRCFTVTGRNQAENQETQNQEVQNQEAQNQEVQNQEAQNQEAQNQEAQNQEAQNQEVQNQEAQNQEAQNQEAQNQEAQNQEPQNEETQDLGAQNPEAQDLEAPNQGSGHGTPKKQQPLEYTTEIRGHQLVLHKGSNRERRLPLIWLRDNCFCSECVNPQTLQRNYNVFAQSPWSIKAKSSRTDKQGVIVDWSDGHQSHYEWRFLLRHTGFPNNRNTWENSKHYWKRDHPSWPPTVSYSNVMESDRGVAELTNKLRAFGFTFVENTPYDDPDKTRQLLERIAFIRVTHYGGFYDFTPDLAMADTAYTNSALPAHTDTTYFSDPAGLQAFHLLSHQPAPGDTSETASGGQSLLVDGFLAAEILKKEDPRAYDILAKTPVNWHSSGNKGISITPDRLYPVLEHRPSDVLYRVRWNNVDRGTVPNLPKFDAVHWYNSARKWVNILQRKQLEYWFQLEPGKVLIFDNWRVLHGRSAFTGIRRICGGYLNRDDVVSRWRTTNWEPQWVLDAARG